MAKNKMITCKTCGKEIAKTAKVCPNCGAKNKKKGHPILGFLGTLLVIIGIAIIAIGSGSSKEVYQVGKIAELNDVSATLISVKESKGLEGFGPTEGNIFLQCEFEIENNSKKELAISSALSFSAYCDNYSCSFSITGLGKNAGTNQLDGVVAPGKKMNGVVAYEVPKDWKKIEIHFKPDVWGGKELIFADKN